MQMSWPLGSDLGKQSRCWRWLAAGTAGVYRAFTKAAKTDSDIDFVLIFHVSTWVSLPLVGSRKLNRCTVLHLQSSCFLPRSMLNVSH